MKAERPRVWMFWGGLEIQEKDFVSSSKKKAKFVSPQPNEVQPGSVWQAPVISGEKRGTTKCVHKILV